MLLLTKYTVLYKENEICCIILLSLPSRERGLKFVIICWDYMPPLSLPSRERGLKFVRLGVDDEFVEVAPFAGAWIEICFQAVHLSCPLTVAPFAGAWIEIPVYSMQ